MPDPAPASPEANLRRLQRRDGAAFAALVEAWQPAILGWCQSLGLRGADIDAAAAEVFWQVYQGLPGFDGRSKIGTWIHRIAWRTIGRVRQQARARAPLELADEPTADHQEPGGLLELREQQERLWAAVTRLEPRQAAAVDLYYRQQMPLEEVAAALECPVGTVKTLLFRARERLKPVLQREGIAP
jgi:RNA polymerase sigma-70 factor (ECF subfamily)